MPTTFPLTGSGVSFSFVSATITSGAYVAPSSFSSTPIFVESVELSGQKMGMDVFTTVDNSPVNSGTQAMQKIPTLLDAGDLTLGLKWIPGNATHVLFETYMLAKTPIWFKLTYEASGRNIVALGYISEHKPGGLSKDKLLTATITIAVSDEWKVSAT